MIITRKRHEAELAAERERGRADMLSVAHHYGKALMRSEALQREMSTWIANKADNITPEQAAQMFYAQDDSWQAAFFNVMQDQVRAHHEAKSEREKVYGFGPGVPAGESQWYHAMGKLDQSGWETVEAMFDHARYHREKAATHLEQSQAGAE